MKRFANSIMVFTLAVGQVALLGQTLPSVIWKGNDKDDGSVHALGNGKMLVYESGTKIFQIGSSPFSTPNLCQMEMVESASLETASTREVGTAIWTHQVYENGVSAGDIVDFVDSDLPCMVRHFRLSDTLRFRLQLMDEVDVIGDSNPSAYLPGVSKLLLRIPEGTHFFEKYTYPRPLYSQIFWKGNIHVVPIENNPEVFAISCFPGESDLWFAGGPEYSQTIQNLEELQNIGYIKALERTRHWWSEFTNRRTNFEATLPSDLPLRQKLIQSIDAVSVAIKAQQSEEGGIIAGYRYPMAYVRDQYGVARGLLALGYFEEAKQILNFYWNIWRKYGEIHNAQGIGVEGVFHIFENDEVEITGYIVLQAFDYFEKSGDNNFLMSIFPLLEWCWEVQKKHLVRGMLPFNGDETYIAGGFLPRSAINDGSAEATMLFIDGGWKMLDWVQENKLWSDVKMESERLVLNNTKNLFHENFWKDGKLLTNNPERVSLTEIPRFRHGACERCGPKCLVVRPVGAKGVDWTVCDENNRYQCPACLVLGPLPKMEPHVYHLLSVGLIPFYMQSTLLQVENLRPMVLKIVQQYLDTGVLSTVTDQEEMISHQGTVGYDYGFLLLAMLGSGIDHTEDLYSKTLSLTDSAGVWAEYYLKDAPYLTRYRPWESAINIEALLRFAMEYQSPGHE